MAPAVRRTRRTPCAWVPETVMSTTRWRTIRPSEVMEMMDSSSRTAWAETTLPLRSAPLIAVTPMPPRCFDMYSLNSVRLP